MNNFDQVVSGCLHIAQSKVLELKNTQLDSFHLLYGLISAPSTYLSTKYSEKMGEVEEQLASLPTSSSEISLEHITPSASFQKWMTQASSHAAKQGSSEVRERDLLVFLPKIFSQLDWDFSRLKEIDEKDEVPEFLINLNERANEGKLDPVIGRTKEIRSVMEILGRRSKNNPVLVGSAGVGKTAIVEGLAEAIIREEVPDVLKGKILYSLELGSLLAGTKFRGEFEERIAKLLKFMKEGAGKYILFIDEIHQLIGAGKTDGAMDAANLLKPALARGELHCIGATTEDEFHKYILKDPALERRFRQVPVREPKKEDTLEILMGLREKFELHHGIKISKDALYSAVMLSDQYITDKFLPDKAIDLIDEASASLKLSAQAMPTSLVLLEGEIRNKKILQQVKSSIEVERELAVLQQKFDQEYAQWSEQVTLLKKVSEYKARLDRLKFDLQKAEREQNYEEASKIKYQEIPNVEKEINSFEHGWVLQADHIAQVISRHTGIPVEKILKSRQDELLQLEENLNKRVFGQTESLKEISEILLTSYAGLKDETRPLGSFLLLGPTGVGKTETAKTLAQNLFDSEENIVRIDLSEYSEKHAVAKLIGAPPGYVGHEDGGILTEAVRRRPYSVVLFDEVEKAHPDFSDILLQILDDGRLTDNKGRVINFKNTVIFMTSNSKEIERDFRPELLGRLDSILYYKPLGREVMKDLVRKQISLLENRLKDKEMKISFSEEVKNHLADLGYSENYGARPLTQVFDRLIIRPLSRRILGGEQEKNLKVKIQEGEIYFTTG